VANADKSPQLRTRAQDHDLGKHLVLGAGLVGRLEVWRKWSPAEGLVENGGDVPWADVCKVVAKRRFSFDGVVERHPEIDHDAARWVFHQVRLKRRRDG
jgi:hypothetical protein